MKKKKTAASATDEILGMRGRHRLALENIDPPDGGEPETGEPESGETWLD